MAEEKETPAPEEQAGDAGRDEAPQAPRRPPTPDDANTVSLLDLISEAADEPPAAEPPAAASRAPAPFVGDLEERPGADEAPTVTGSLPTEPPKTRPTARRPLTAQDMAPSDRPPVVDDQATRVQPRSAFPGETQIGPTRPRPANTTRRAAQRTARVPAGPPVRAAQPTARAAPPPIVRPRTSQFGRRLGCLGRLVTAMIILLVVGLIAGAAASAVGYVVIASQLPRPTELRERASTFETARVLDRQGNLIYALADPSTGNRTYVPLPEIDEDLRNATIATEDERFYSNPGFDPLAIGRAVAQAAQEREVVSGASTITQQLARALLLDEEERTQQTFSRKVKEIILAAELFRTYPKDEILELYLNEIYYGNRAYGIEAAAQTYFGKSAADLTVAEASLLAGLPQAPALWDPYTNPEAALGRQREVLGLMVASGYITAAEAQAAIDESAAVVRNMRPAEVTIPYPHFVFTVLQQLEAQIGAQAIYRGGLRIYTTLDPAAQRLAEESIATHRDALNAAGANNAAIVVVQPQSGEVLALVGSVDFNNEAISGQVNMALAPRQPGSALKPLVYLTAFEQGWTPATLIWDVPTTFANPGGPEYTPKNFDDEFHGPMRVRPALGNSYNVPAVKALEYVGVCNFIANVQKVGFSTLLDTGCTEIGQPREHGLSLALGGGEVPPLDMAAAFGALANGGRYLAPYTISRIEDRAGELILEQRPPDQAASLVIRPDHAYLLTSILADNNARQPEFGQNNELVIPGHTVAVKTGTSGTERADVRDGWTIGYTPEVVAAVWTGNTDNEPVAAGQSGYRMAAPIWNDFMTAYLADRPAVEFARPASISEIEICADSGARPGEGCASRTVELFAGDQPPADDTQDFLSKVFIDLWTHQRATPDCQESPYQATFFNLVVYARPENAPREQANARAWLEQSAGGQAWSAQRNIGLPLQLPPELECNESTPRPVVSISQPQPMQEVGGIIDVVGTARGPNFAGYLIEYGLDYEPLGWGLAQAQRPEMVENGLLGRVDTAGLPGGRLAIRVVIVGPDNPYTAEHDPVALEARVPLNLLEPTPTPSPTPTETPTPSATPTTTVTPTPSSTAPITPSPSPTASSADEELTPTPSSTPAPP